MDKKKELEGLYQTMSHDEREFMLLLAKHTANSSEPTQTLMKIVGRVMAITEGDATSEEKITEIDACLQESRSKYLESILSGSSKKQSVR